MIRDIAGRQNHTVKLVRKLQHKKYRRERGLLVCEGMDLLEAAVGAGVEIQDVLVREGLLRDLPAGLVAEAKERPEPGLGTDIGVCDEPTISYASSLGGAADVIFTCAQPHTSLGDLSLTAGTTLFLDGVGDPGNVGTVVRSAVAFGVLAVLSSPGTADAFSPKAMRAGMGAQFTVPIVADVAAEDLLAHLAGLRARAEEVPEVWLADPHEGEDVGLATSPSGVVIVLGAERVGLGQGWGATRRVTIPHGRVESLNVAMAGTIFAYESWRRRGRSTGGN